MFDAVELARLNDRSEQLQKQMREQQRNRTTLGGTWTIGEVAAMVGRTSDGLRSAEQGGKIPAPLKNPETGRRVGYTISELQAIQEHYQVVPHRPAGEQTKILAVHNLKGGVAKTTLAVHICQYAAIRGLNTLLLDCDSQASATRLMSYVPDVDFTEPEDTIEAFFRGEQNDLAYAKRKTHIPRMDIIPSSLLVFYAEFVLNKRARQGDPREPYLELSRGLAPLLPEYDLVVIDAPPSMGIMGLNVMYVASSLLVPVPTSMLDFSSTLQYLSMLGDAAEQLEEMFGRALTYDWFRAVVTKQRSERAGRDASGQARLQDDMLAMCESFFGPYLLRNPLLYSTEIESASDCGKSLFDLEEPIGTQRTNKRAMRSMLNVCQEVFHLLTGDWQPEPKRRV